VPLQIKFLELSGTEKKALHWSKAKNVTLYGTSLPRLCKCLQLQGLRAAIAATGAGLNLFFLLCNASTNTDWNSSVLGLIIFHIKWIKKLDLTKRKLPVSSSLQWPAAVGWRPTSGLTNALIKNDKPCQ
jgi:hypothetical protein